jgi:hypothetical protein
LAVTLQGEVCDILGIENDQAFMLGRYIYGMPNAGKAYYIAFSNHIVENGYTKSLLDPCLFYKIYNDNVKDIILICIHVDDIYLFSSDIHYIHEFNQKLEQKFKITVDMEADKYLGILLTRMDDGSIKMQQPKLLAALFDEFADELSKTKKKKVTALTSQSLINAKSTTSTFYFQA